jgi:sugar phosphate isomerase/epimerase
MTLHVLFTEDGIPGWIGSDPRDGSEAVEGLTVAFLAAHRRTARGKWVARAPVEPVEPSAEEIAREREAAYLATLAARDEALRAALAAEADPLFFRWQRDEVAKEDWLAAVAEVKARFPKPEQV